MNSNSSVSIIGLGYVGLPLAIAFRRHLKTIGFDTHREKIDALLSGKDPSEQVSAEELLNRKNLQLTSDPKDLSDVDFHILAVPTPIDSSNRPDLAMLSSACKTVGQQMKKGAVVIIESTVYPGLTEEFCIPILEKASGLRAGEDFGVGYSPERVNPGDQEHSLEQITKVVAGIDEPTLKAVTELYSLVVGTSGKNGAGVYPASSIQVAEAAKVIENTQRDLNIALMNELAIIFDRMGIDTTEVLEAAGTKWNFLKFKPGLVGGHCIGVDPYYLTHKAEMLKYNPEIILAGRRINDSMGKFIAEKTVKLMTSQGLPVKDANILIMGMTFKENCNDIRNTRVIDIIQELRSYGAKISVWDPIADPNEVEKHYGLTLTTLSQVSQLNAIICAVAHKEFQTLSPDELAERSNPGIPFVDVKSTFSEKALQEKGFQVWRL